MMFSKIKAYFYDKLEYMGFVYMLGYIHPNDITKQYYSK